MNKWEKWDREKEKMLLFSFYFIKTVRRLGNRFPDYMNLKIQLLSQMNIVPHLKYISVQ